MFQNVKRKFSWPDWRDEQGIRAAIALLYVAVIVAFFTWFFATHLQRIE